MEALNHFEETTTLRTNDQIAQIPRKSIRNKDGHKPPPVKSQVVTYMNLQDDLTPKDRHESSSDEKPAQVSQFSKPYATNASRQGRKGMISSSDANVADRINQYY